MLTNAYAAIGSRESGADETNRLDFVIRSVVNKLATMTLVQVKAVNGQMVDILPLVSQIDGADNEVKHGVIHNAPVFRLQSGTSAIIIDPVEGDIGLAIFAHNDISKAKATKAPALPGSRRKFDWADAIYLGGVLNGTPTSFVQFLTSGGIDIKAVGGNVVLSSDQTIMFSSQSGTSTNGPLSAGNGATGAFTSQDGKTVTVLNGIITRIAP